eukprot:12135507-Heterocapsa_arctica.AAC.1
MRGRSGEHDWRAIAQTVAHFHGQQGPSDRFGGSAMQQAAYARHHRGQRDRQNGILPSAPL